MEEREGLGSNFSPHVVQHVRAFYATRVHTRLRTLKIILCSGVVVLLLRAIGSEDLTEQRCGGNFPFGGRIRSSVWSGGRGGMIRVCGEGAV